MMSRTDHGAPVRDAGGQGADAHEPIVALAAVVRAVLAARLHDRDVVEDLVQETLARLLEARPRLDDGVLAAYAVATRPQPDDGASAGAGRAAPPR